jgi:hypothetical protein
MRRVAAFRIRDWGPWKLNERTLELQHDGYHVELLECLSSARSLDLIAQISHKSWATPEVLAGFVRALDDVIGFQQHQCSAGRNHRVNRGLIMARVNELIELGAPMAHAG